MHNLLSKTVCITGGTSGLGLALVKKFCSSGYNVLSISRDRKRKEMKMANLRSIGCDLSNLADVKRFADLVSNEGIKIDILINNAGVLSPPRFQRTADGFEFSYQVNFLSHYLLTRLLQRYDQFNPDLIVNVSSPIYKHGSFDISNAKNESNYRLFKAYANSKLCMAMFSKRLANERLNSFSFNPGTFNSGIYRHQDKWFHYVYKIAAPFMVRSSKVAAGLYRTVESRSWENGKMVNKKGQFTNLIKLDEQKITTFWRLVDNQISDWLQE